MKSALANFQTLPLKDASRQLLAKLGYQSEKFIAGAGSSPQAFLDLFASGHAFDRAKALVSDWKSADLLFQLTDQELSRESSLFTDDSVQRGLLKSYVFIAIELKGSDYARGKFSAITRQINRLFPMPVMVLFKCGADIPVCDSDKKADRNVRPTLTIAVINRRANKLDESKDVLGKVTLIREIDFAQPHRGHLDILTSLALSELKHPQKKPITDFDTLHAAWEQIFNVELLNERFYRELANWYFWALPQVEFPADLEPDDEKRRATGLIRLLTRLIFCWFLKEKGLIPEKLFHTVDLEKLLTDLSPDSSTYYQAILQNLFFATLNQRMGKDGKGNPYRVFAKDEGFLKNRATYDVNNLYRYESLFREGPEAALAHFADIPFLNGGLFECLDRTEDGTDKKRYLDGFSRNAKKRPTVPNRLFFGNEHEEDLSGAYGDTKRRKEKVSGLIHILNRYKFTIVENTPIDQEIALDPELLGKVFENLLASYNEETKTTARKQTGSFYTPRPIVDYMVDESLKAHLTRALVEKAGMKEPDACVGLDLLFAYTEKEHAFIPAEVATLIAAIDALKVLDPACGSGAFPMGVLHKLVTILGKLDPDNERWKATQLAKLDSAPMREQLEAAFADNADDYGRKLYLIENCLYGVDIQPIAIQITKLRFFISLVCDQKTNRNKKDNHGILPLPNLETKFVAADTLIGLPEMEETLFVDPRVGLIEKEIETLYHGHFSIQRRDQKLALQRKIKARRDDIRDIIEEKIQEARKPILNWIKSENEYLALLTKALGKPNANASDKKRMLAEVRRREAAIVRLQASLTQDDEIGRKAKHIAEWNPFDPQSSADFFDPHWMFGRALAGGFDITIGNPPYVRADEQSEWNQRQRQQILASGLYETLWEKWDLYVPFIERGYKLLRPGGVSTMIVSDAFCHSKYAQKAQNWFLKNSRIRRLDFCGELKIFDAAVHNVITCFQRADGATWKPERRVHHNTFGEVTLLPTDEQAKLTNRLFFPEDGVAQTFACNGVPLDSICYVTIGMVVNAHEDLAQGAFTMEDLVQDSRDATHPKRFVEGKHLGMWLPTTHRWLEWGTDRAPALFRRKTFPEIYNRPEKILVQRSPGPDPKCCYDDQHLHFTESTVSFILWHSLHGVRNNSLKKAARYLGEKPQRPDLPKREELEATSRRFAVKYLLGVMNSASAREFLRANRRSNIHLYPDDWKKLPIPDVSPAQQQPIVALVERILTAKRANPSADIAALEVEVDTQVATLYGLSPTSVI